MSEFEPHPGEVDWLERSTNGHEQMKHNDYYQERYMAHQARKKEVLKEIVRERHSERQFGEGRIDDEIVADIIRDTEHCPSSCDRQAISIHLVDDRDSKALLGGLLVGGTGWIHRADRILLLFADPVAYKAGDEIKFMPFLDSGVVAQQLYLSATANDLAVCYCNPNIREENKEFFASRFGDKIFCGAIAIGNKHE